jgi:hypothetical protein
MKEKRIDMEKGAKWLGRIIAGLTKSLPSHSMCHSLVGNFKSQPVVNLWQDCLFPQFPQFPLDAIMNDT